MHGWLPRPENARLRDYWLSTQMLAKGCRPRRLSQPDRGPVSVPAVITAAKAGRGAAARPHQTASRAAVTSRICGRGRLMRLGQASSHGLAQAGYIKIGAQGSAQIAIDEVHILRRPQ